jgi:hypothetical protein
MSARRPPMQTHGYEQTCNAACSYTNPEEWVLDETGGEHGSEGLTFDMSGGGKQAKLAFGRPLDGRVRAQPHVGHLLRSRPNSLATKSATPTLA